MIENSNPLQPNNNDRFDQLFNMVLSMNDHLIVIETRLLETNKLDKIIGMIVDLQNQVNGIEDRLASFEVRFDKFEARFNSMEERFEELVIRVDKIEATLEAVKQQVGSIEHEVKELRIDMKDGFVNLRRRQTMDEQDLVDLVERVNKIEERLSDLESKKN